MPDPAPHESRRPLHGRDGSRRALPALPQGFHDRCVPAHRVVDAVPQHAQVLMQGHVGQHTELRKLGLQRTDGARHQSVDCRLRAWQRRPGRAARPVPGGRRAPVVSPRRTPHERQSQLLRHAREVSRGAVHHLRLSGADPRGPRRRGHDRVPDRHDRDDDASRRSANQPQDLRLLRATRAPGPASPRDRVRRIPRSRVGPPRSSAARDVRRRLYEPRDGADHRRHDAGRQRRRCHRPHRVG